MGSIDLLIQPNVHSEVYRNLPPKLDVVAFEKYLDFIDVNKDGCVLVGSSNLTGRIWNGSIWYYEGWPTNLEQYVAKKSIASGVTDGKFMNDGKKMLIADDSGVIQLISVNKSTDTTEEDILQTTVLAEEHEAGITELSLSASGRYFLTSSMDCSIKLWDIERTRVESNEYFDAVNTYINAHKDGVTSVCANSTKDEIFASCSMDREALIWDIRLENPATLVYQNEFCTLTRILWHPTRDNMFVVSSEKGDLYMVDIRDPGQFVSKAEHFNRSIFKMRFSDSGLLAVCADNNEVKVVDPLNEFYIIYEHSEHSDMVRGLAWMNDSHLLSCAWDKTVCNHYLKLS